jgi:hypothetical protein
MVSIQRRETAPNFRVHPQRSRAIGPAESRLVYGLLMISPSIIG